jgi:hypothetical protein
MENLGQDHVPVGVPFRYRFRKERPLRPSAITLSSFRRPYTEAGRNFNVRCFTSRVNLMLVFIGYLAFGIRNAKTPSRKTTHWIKTDTAGFFVRLCLERHIVGTGSYH